MKLCRLTLLVLALAPLCWAFGSDTLAAEPATASTVPAFSPDDLAFFEQQVRPILSANCYSCHGAEKQESKLRLDSRTGVLAGGESGPAIEAGKPGESTLIDAVNYGEVYKMPPKGKLSAAEIATLTEWVARGAPWPPGEVAPTAAPPKKPFNLRERADFWSFKPLAEHPVPNVHNAEWSKNPIDRFVLAKMEAAGVAPAPPADKRTLLRRVTYDLIGLPPTPDEIRAFLADTSPDAFAHVVDRLLASPQYGERWGRHWLDLVRYAETGGHEFDFELPYAYEYRDYVIRALNADIPYDQFVREQIAGDLLPNPRRNAKDGFNESILGTGFYYLGESIHSPVDVRKDEADRADNQIDVLAKTFLGLTVSCARCHDHKFDAISTKDYYALAGFLRSSRYDVACVDDPAGRRNLAEQLTHLHQREQALARQVHALSKRNELARVGAAGWNVYLKPAASRSPSDPFYAWTVLCPAEGPLTPESFAERRKQLVADLRAQAAAAEAQRAKIEVFESFDNGSYDGWSTTGEAFGERPTAVAEAVITAGVADPLERLMPAGVAYSGALAGKLEGTLRSRTFTISKSHVLYRAAGHAARINLIVDGFQRIQAPIYGGLALPLESDTFTWRAQDVSKWIGHDAYVEVLDRGDGYAAIDEIVFSDGATPPAETPALSLAKLLDDEQITTPEALNARYLAVFQDTLDRWQAGTLGTAEPWRQKLLTRLLVEGWPADAPQAPSASGEQSAQWKAMQAESTTLARQIAYHHRAMVTTDGTGENEQVFVRGNHKTLGDEVPRRFLEALAGEQPPIASGSGRLELANRLLDERNPLPARVIVNRLWQHHFARGIVATPDDFGHMGEAPTHPELLDYLALDLRRNGWSLKRLHRQMLLSQTYQMASTASPAADAADPQNLLLHRMPIRRLEAESIRDAMLAVSGRLDLKMFGPSITPYLTPFMEGRGRPSTSGPLDGDGRRSLYISVRRNFLSPMLLAFDYPIPFSTIGRRSVSNVPAQALTMMNNPLVEQLAERWAERVLAEPSQHDSDRVERMYEAAFARDPLPDELAAAQAFLDGQRQVYGAQETTRPWTDLAHVLFSVKEFIFLN